MILDQLKRRKDEGQSLDEHIARRVERLESTTL